MFFTKKEKIHLNSLRIDFDAQKKTLLDHNYPALLNITPEEFSNELEKVWNLLKEKMDGVEIIQKGTIPLLLVVNAGDIKQKMEKIKAHTELDLQKISLASNSNPFSILLQVENGMHMVAKSPKDALKKFEKEKRFALDIHQSIALLTHFPLLLQSHYVISAGTFYTTKDNESLPLLWLQDEHKNPELHYAWFHIAHGSYGTPSYSIKI